MPDNKQAAKQTAKTEPTEKKPGSAAKNWLASVEEKITADRASIFKILLGVVALAILFLLAFGALIYKYKSSSNIVYAVSKVVPYPVVTVNGHYGTYGEYLFEVRTLERYAESQASEQGQPQVNFSSKAGHAQLVTIENTALQDIKNRLIVKQLATTYKVKVTSKELNDDVTNLKNQSGGDKKFQEVLASVYGWTINDLRHELYYQIQQQKVSQAISNDSKITAPAKAKAEEVLAKVKAGGDFAQLAQQYSQDTSASNGGDIGFIRKADVVPEFANAAFALQVGQTSDLVKSQYGYHIIKVLEKKDDQVHAAHILIKTVDPQQYIQDKVTHAKVHTFFKAS